MNFDESSNKEKSHSQVEIYDGLTVRIITVQHGEEYFDLFLLFQYGNHENFSNMIIRNRLATFSLSWIIVKIISLPKRRSFCY